MLTSYWYCKHLKAKYTVINVCFYLEVYPGTLCIRHCLPITDYDLVIYIYTGWPKKVATITNHYKIVLKRAIMATFVIDFDYKMSTRI